MTSEFTRKISSELIMDSMPGMVYIFSREGYLVAWNKRVEEQLGYSEVELQNKYISEFPVESESDKLLSAFQKVFASGYLQFETVLKTKDGERLNVFESGSKVVYEGKEYFVGLSMDISELNSARKQIAEQLNEISKLNELLKAENVYLKGQLEVGGNNYEMVGESESLKYLLFKISQVAPTDASVLIEGETGTGKELVARAIHNESKRKDKPFIKVNCASIPENLIESELFGHEKGAFTGAVAKRIGRFELADGGTIFLDEIGELPLNIQPKLLHVLQQGEFERIGSSKTIKTDVRVISATNKVLKDEIKKSNFRTDLYYRLNVFPISVSSLRDRKADIAPLVLYYTRLFSEKLNKPIKVITKSTLQQLVDYSWPGNIRELENVIERAVITSQNESLDLESLPKSDLVSHDHIPLIELEKNHIIKTLEKTYWKISGKGGAAELLKINPETLRSKMYKMGIKREKMNQR